MTPAAGVAGSATICKHPYGCQFSPLNALSRSARSFSQAAYYDPTFFDQRPERLIKYT